MTGGGGNFGLALVVFSLFSILKEQPSPVSTRPLSDHRPFFFSSFSFLRPLPPPIDTLVVFRLFKTLLKKFHKGLPKVRTQISLAVAALAVHVHVEDWGDGGIVNWLREEMNSRPECIPGFLELLKVLPEEIFNYRISARPERRRQFEKELTSAWEVALSILTACMNISELKEQVLEAFASWLRVRRGISAAVLASHPLVHDALSSLSCDLLSEAAVNDAVWSRCMLMVLGVSQGEMQMVFGVSQGEMQMVHRICLLV